MVNKKSNSHFVAFRWLLPGIGTLKTTCLLLSLLIVSVVNAQSGTQLADIETIHDIAFDSSGQYLAIGGRVDNQPGFWIYNTITGTVDGIPTGGSVRSVAWSPDNSMLAGNIAVGNAETYQVFDVASHQLLLSFEHDLSVYPSILWSADGTQVATTSGYWIGIRNATTGNIEVLPSLEDTDTDAPITHFGWDSISNRVYGLVGYDMIVFVWDSLNGDLIGEFSLPFHSEAFALSPDATQLAVGSLDGDGSILILDSLSGATITELQTDPGTAHVDLVWHPSSTQLAARGGGVVRIWDTVTGQQIHEVPIVTSYVWSPDGSQFVTAAFRPPDVEEDIKFVQFPTASAGPDQIVDDADSSGAEIVTLNGSASYDPDGIIESYVWTEDDVEIATGVNPQVGLSVGVHTITLIVTDDDEATSIDEVIIVVNQLPVADAGPDQLVETVNANSSTLVTLDGSGSSDPDGTIESYVWTENDVEIATGVNPQVELSIGLHTIILTVTDDDDATASDEVIVIVNQVPVADAGPDQIISDTDGSGAELVTLDGSGSSDPDGTIEGYVWTENDIEIATGVNPQAELSAGVHTIVLTVTDDHDATATDEVVITIEQPPLADAGPDQLVETVNGSATALVTLDGSGSYDPNGTIISYVWTEDGQEIATGVNPQLELGLGIHIITLTVTDDDTLTATDEVVVEVACGMAAPGGTPTHTVAAGDVSGLIAAINASNGNPDADIISLSPLDANGDYQPYTLTAVNNTTNGPNGLPVISSDITIYGNCATIQRDPGAPAFRFFHLAGWVDSSLTLYDLTLTGGNSGAGNNGGAISGWGPLGIHNSTLSGNTAGNNGGALQIDAGTVTITGSVITGNTAGNKGGGINNQGDLTITGTTLADNSAGGRGGGLHNGTSGDVIITGSTITGNTATTDGGGLYNNGALGAFGLLEISLSTIADNSAGNDGGGIFNSGDLDVSLTYITGNDAGHKGGGIFASWPGGGIPLQANPVHSTCITDNVSPLGGAGAHGEPLYATNNWWGDASGPYNPTLNPNGQGNSAQGGVAFSPWATTDNVCVPQ